LVTKFLIGHCLQNVLGKAGQTKNAAGYAITSPHTSLALVYQVGRSALVIIKNCRKLPKNQNQLRTDRSLAKTRQYHHKTSNFQCVCDHTNCNNLVQICVLIAVSTLR